jgi:hypothetical protein
VTSEEGGALLPPPACHTESKSTSLSLSRGLALVLALLPPAQVLAHELLLLPQLALLLLLSTLLLLSKPAHESDTRRRSCAVWRWPAHTRGGGSILS